MKRFYHNIVDLPPALLILFSFFGAILSGAFLLWLPVSSAGDSLSLVDALFTATSAICVTGLIVVDTGSHFSMIGQMVILFMIQIGGLGVMTVSVIIFKYLGRAITFRQRMAMQDVFAHTPRRDIYKLLKTIIIFTFWTEVVGAVFLLPSMMGKLPFHKALFSALFHSISAFCNAGFSLFSDSLCGFSGSLPVNFTVSLLIILGGIGFPVIYDLYSRYHSSARRKPKLSVQTKLTIITSLFLVVFGASVLWILEDNAAFKQLGTMDTIMASIFQSVTCRTAGFNSIDISTLSEASLGFMLALMFIGASPGSCGGGVKTTTFAVIAAFTYSRIRGKRQINLFKKTLPQETINRAIALLMISLILIFIITFFVLITMPRGVERDEANFLAILFETVSAFATVGLSMGITAELTSAAKLWIILLMFIGRVGVLTFSYFIVSTVVADGREHAEESVMIG